MNLKKKKKKACYCIVSQCWCATLAQNFQLNAFSISHVSLPLCYFLILFFMYLMCLFLSIDPSFYFTHSHFIYCWLISFYSYIYFIFISSKLFFFNIYMYCLCISIGYISVILFFFFQFIFS